MHRRYARIAAAALAGAMALLPMTGAGAAPVASGVLDLQPGFYSVPYSDVLYWATPTGTFSQATYAQWASQGFPAPKPAQVRYVKAPWLSTIMGVVGTPRGGPFSGMDYTSLTYSAWARAGFPNPEVTTALPMYVLQYRQNPPDPTIWASMGKEFHALTPAEWASVGSPQPLRGSFPLPDPPAPVVAYIGYESSPELFSISSGVMHKLTFSEWAAARYPTPIKRANGFYKLSWDDGIALIDPDFTSHLLDLSAWASYGYPTPSVDSTIVGDSYCYDTAKGAVHYDGATVQDYLTDQEVVAYLGVKVSDVADCVA